MNIKNLVPSETLRRLNPLLYPSVHVHGRGPEALERESDLHEKIFSECRARGWIAFHGSMAERTHRTKGEPDFIILASDGRVLLIECKTKVGKLSTEQAGIAHQAKRLGHAIVIVRSFAEFLAAL